MRKGQTITLDLIFALTLALAIIFVINSQWNILLKNIDNYETKMSIEKAAHVSALYLINGVGYPANWNSSNVRLIGLTDKLNVIAPVKFNELMKISNNSLGEALGVPEYNVFVNLTTTNGQTINSTGVRPAGHSASAVVQSFVSFNNTLSTLYVTVWK